MALRTGLATAPPHKKLDAFFGIGVETQRRIGTFVVLCSMLEMQIDHVAITLKGDLSKAKPVWTDKLVISDMIVATTKLLDRIKHEGLREIVRQALGAAEDLLVIRHTVIHGVPLAATSTDAGALVRNKSWFGEMRRRQSSQIEMDNQLLDEATAIVDILFKTLGQSMSAIFEPVSLEILLAEREQLRAAAGRAAEMKAQALAAMTSDPEV